MNKQSDIEVASELYTKYCVDVGGKAFNGDPLPDWATFSADPKKQLQANAWIQVAVNARAIFSE